MKCSHGVRNDKPCRWCEQDMRDVAEWSAALDAVERSGLLPAYASPPPTDYSPDPQQ